ncbi:MAG: hypothetical protein JWQ49_4409 [Edaphobacter sp.]|nr:hypothetical protein [Edaphobacter sp.]
MSIPHLPFIRSGNLYLDSTFYLLTLFQFRWLFTRQIDSNRSSWERTMPLNSSSPFTPACVSLSSKQCALSITPPVISSAHGLHSKGKRKRILCIVDSFSSLEGVDKRLRDLEPVRISTTRFRPVLPMSGRSFCSDRALHPNSHGVRPTNWHRSGMSAVPVG